MGWEREENAVTLLREPALVVRTDGSDGSDGYEDQSKSIFQVFNGPCPLNMKGLTQAP